MNLYLYKVIKQKSNTIINDHCKNLTELRLERRQILNFDTVSVIKQTAHYYSSCNLSPKEEKTFSFGLDEHIPSNINRNQLFTVFELLY